MAMSLFLSKYSRLLVVSLPPSHHLDVTLTQAVQVGTDAHGATRDVGQREGVLQQQDMSTLNADSSSVGCVQGR